VAGGGILSQPGSTIGLVKAALIVSLQSRLPNVNYESPISPIDTLGDDGSGDAIWWFDDADSSESVLVFKGAPHWWDEDYTLSLIVQSLGRDTDADQVAVDSRAINMLGEVLGVLASDPTIGIVDTSQYQLRTVLPDGWTFHTGIQTTGLKRAAMFKLDLRVSARIMLQAS
jgi:hypothetical protein